MLLGVGGEVLDGGAHVPALHAVDIAGGHLSGQEGVLGEILEIAPAQRGALDVHRGAEHHGQLFMLAGIADGLAHAADHVHVEGRRRSAGRREAHGLDALVHAQVVGLVVLLAQPVGAVGDHRGGHAQALHRLGVPEIQARAQPGLLLQGHLGDELFDVHRYRLLYVQYISWPSDPPWTGPTPRGSSARRRSAAWCRRPWG